MDESRSDDAQIAGPRAGLRAMEVILALASCKTEMSIGELTVALDLPRASLHRLLRMLEGAGYLKNRAGNYRLGPRSYELARTIGIGVREGDFPLCARPVVERLSASTDETVILGILSESRREIIYADVLVADSPLRYAVPAGDRRPLYSSASGKAVLAFFPPEDLEQYVRETKFEPITRFTTSKQTLDTVLELARNTGVVVDKGGHHVGAIAVASPVFEAGGSAFCAVVVAGPSVRLQNQIPRIRKLVHEAGREISSIMGYDGPYPGS